MGHYPQVKEVVYHCKWDDENFVGNFHFEQINIHPIVATPVLYPNSKLTDLIYIWHTGFSFTKLVSGKLKSFLDKSRSTGLQFIQCNIIHNGSECMDYFLMNIYEMNNELIDFSKSTIFSKKYDPNKTENGNVIKVSSMLEFDKLIKEKNVFDELYLNNIYFQESSLDFFLIKNPIKYIVSEKLKKEIEDADCTGIEFQPVELSLREWLHGGEREKIYGKA